MNICFKNHCPFVHPWFFCPSLLMVVDKLVIQVVFFKNKKIKRIHKILKIRYEICLLKIKCSLIKGIRNVFNSYLSHCMIDSFPRIFKWKIIILKLVLLDPKCWSLTKLVLILKFFILIFVENCIGITQCYTRFFSMTENRL